MRTSQDGINLIKSFEGFSATPYRCSADVLTIGYGHTGAGVNKKRITESEGEKILRNDLATAEKAVLRLCGDNLKQHQFDTLVSFAFNLGAGSLQRSTLRQKVLRGEHQAAADEFLKWIYAGGKKSNGLLRRRMVEAAMYRGQNI